MDSRIVFTLFLISASGLTASSSLPVTVNSNDVTILSENVSSHVKINETVVHRYPVATFDFNRVATPYIISLWIIIVGLAKIGFHVTPKLSSICPESVVLMALGVIIGLIIYVGVDPEVREKTMQPLTPNLFFFYMLPPIVMDAGYHMPNRLFFDNLSSILIYAVLGTVWNALGIGFALYFCAQSGIFTFEMSLLDTLLFSSIVSAVDPVAVLAIFEEIQVNEILYIIVFGESLLNDAVTVVLYHMFEGYSEMGLDNIIVLDYLAGIASFFVISLGGVIMGIIWGFAAAFVSRFTIHVKIIEPIFVFVMAYLAYLSAEMFHLSRILSLTFCGITMKNYVEENITQTSQTTLKYAMKMLANSSESIIFLFLGVCTVNDDHDWNTLFVVLTIFFCLVFRSLGVVILTAITNKFRLHKLSAIEQFILSYGGLRGAVAFALVLVVNEEIIPSKKMMVTTVIALVYFTVFLQGMTVGPLVKILKVPLSNKFESSMNERIHTRLMDHLMAGVEDISGMMVGNYKIRDKFRHLNNQYLRQWFLRDSHERGNSSRKIIETCSRLNLQDAMNMVNKQNLLQVYGNNNNNLTTSKSLSALFRTYTQANLTNMEAGDVENNSVLYSTPNDSTFNFDIGNVEYSPSKRDLAEAEIHHILNDSMFQPIKRYRRYSKSDLSDPPHSHPPFQHQMRLQIRHLMDQNRYKKRHKKVNGNSRLNKRVNDTDNDNSVRHPAPSKSNYLEVPSINSPRPLNTINTNDTDFGITFTVKPVQSAPSLSSAPSTSLEPLSSTDNSLDEPKTATENTLPWRRGSMVYEGADSASGPLKQEEFPPWIANKEYIVNYASPTNTLLNTFDKEHRSVYEIFTITEGSEPKLNDLSPTSNASDGNNETAEPGSAAINLGFVDDKSLPTVYRL